MSKRPMNGMHQSNGPQWDIEKGNCSAVHGSSEGAGCLLSIAS